MKSIIETLPASRCYLCGAYGSLEKHHIFEGNPNRKWSEKYGLTVHLCPYCHRDNKHGAHSDPIIADHLHKIGQRAFEKNYSREEFYHVFGRYYLEEGEEGGRS